MTANQKSAGPDEAFRILKRSLNARIKQTGDTGIARRHWNRVIKEATETTDLTLLKRLDTYFDLAPGAVLRAQHMITKYQLDDSDESYDQLVTFISQLKRTFIDDDEIHAFLPMLKKRPNDQERIADLITSNTTQEITSLWEQSTPEKIEPLLDAPIDDSWLPPSLRHYVCHSSAPITDRKHLSMIIDPENHNNDAIQDIDESVLHYFADGLRTGRITPAHLEGLLWDQTHGKRTMQYSLLLESVNDIDTSRRERDSDDVRRGLSGVTAYDFFNGLFFMNPAVNDRKIHLELLPMSTEQEFAEESALFRFGILLRGGIIRYYRGRRNNASGGHGEQITDHSLMEAIREQNTPEEVARIADAASTIHERKMQEAVSRMSASYKSITDEEGTHE